MAVLVLILLVLVVPSVGYALAQWFVIILAGGAIVLYLRRQRVRTVANGLLGSPAIRGRRP